VTAVPQPPPLAERRRYEAWIVLGILILLIWGMSLRPEKGSAEQVTDLSAAQIELKTEFLQRSVLGAGNILSALKDDSSKRYLDKRRTDPVAAEFYAAKQLLENGKIKPTDLAPMQKSQDSVDRNAAAVFASSRLDPATVPSLVAGMGKRGFLGRLMAAQAWQKAGDSRPIRSLSHIVRNGFFALSAVWGLILVGSPLLWIGVLVGWLRGDLKPLGVPIALRSLPAADRFAMRAAQLLGMFFALDLVAEVLAIRFFAENMSAAVTQIILGLLMIPAVILLFQTSLYGQKISLRAIGVQPTRLLKLVGIGVLGFLMEYPVALLLAGLGNWLFGRLHQATHPVTTQLVESPSTLYIYAALFFASVVAPFWEEIMFRGLLFPAFSRLFNRPAWGVVASSFIFGAIHPQGLPLWIMLMGLACMSCGMVYYSKSLVPSIVMHALHNGVTLLMVLTLT